MSSVRAIPLAFSKVSTVHCQNILIATIRTQRCCTDVTLELRNVTPSSKSNVI